MRKIKQFTSWGNFVDVGTTDYIYKDVILCPLPTDKDFHVLETRNGDTTIIPTIDIKYIRRPGYHAMQVK